MSLRPLPAGRGGYRRLVPGGGTSPHVHRTELAPVPSRVGEPLVTVAQLSDLHVCDVQSPARVEFLDRWADPDSPVADVIGEVGTYRAQDMLTTQVLAAMLSAVDAVPHGPVGKAALDVAVLTGDNVDNAQVNELDWYLTLLRGGTVQPDSGDPGRWEGVAGRDPRYWCPEVAGADLPQRHFGFPAIPGLLAAARRRFDAAGLDLPWLAVHGNHDRLFQGTWAEGFDPTSALKRLAPDPAALDPLAIMRGLADCDPGALAAIAGGPAFAVTADPGRRRLATGEFAAAHRAAGGHGFAAPGRAWYRHDLVDAVTLLTLDTVDPYGGWQGSIDAEQADWLAGELVDADRERRYVVLASHHPLADLVNDRTAGEPRVLRGGVEALLGPHRCVVLWLDGHTHATAVHPRGGFWEVTAPSLIDWPQQGRIVELLRGDGTLTVATTMLDHAGPAMPRHGDESPFALAGLSRELAANDWQWRATPLEKHPRAGAPADRNALLHLPDPWYRGGR